MLAPTSIVQDAPQETKATGIDAEVLNRAEQLYRADYTNYVRKLLQAVEGKRVTSTLAGNSGFILHLERSQWVAAYLANARLEYAVGSEPPSSSIVQRLHNVEYGDPHAPLPADLPYASEPCNLAAEVAQSVDQIITGFAFGESCFNFCFPEGMELDTSISRDSHGRLTLRVFWEQW